MSIKLSDREFLQFYKLMLKKMLAKEKIDKKDYESLISLIKEWPYEFINRITLEYIQ
jgi:hypothetical protein